MSIGYGSFLLLHPHVEESPRPGVGAQDFSASNSSFLPSGYDSHSHGESPINGGFNGKIIYKWAIFHGYVK